MDDRPGPVPIDFKHATGFKIPQQVVAETASLEPIIIALPLLLVIVTGLLLQLKKQLEWVQPITMTGTTSQAEPELDWQQILHVVSCENYAKANIKTWSDIDRLDVRPAQGIVKVRSTNGHELQLDLATAEVLSFEYRRSDWIESLHDGSFFSEFAKLWIFLPSGVVLLGLWLSGIYLWFLPIIVKRRKRTKQSGEIFRRTPTSD